MRVLEQELGVARLMKNACSLAEVSGITKAMSTVSQTLTSATRPTHSPGTCQKFCPKVWRCGLSVILLSKNYVSRWLFGRNLQPSDSSLLQLGPSFFLPEDTLLNAAMEHLPVLLRTHTQNARQCFAALDFRIFIPVQVIPLFSLLIQ